jgi:hypothetical protein
MTVAPSVSAAASTRVATCSSITKSVVAADGFSAATKPKITAYNYTKVSSNPANALGTTIDFGAKALVVSCVSPSDIKKLSAIAQGSTKPTMSATQYMAYLVKQSAGSMTKTPVGGVSDYLDQGSGKEDGLGSTSSASSVRLDAWIAGNFIILTQTVPATATPSKPLLAFIKTTEKSL